MCLQCASSGLPLAFQWCSSVPIMQINTGSPLGHHWVLASASVCPVASQCTCDSSSVPVCSNYANKHWISSGTPLGASVSQCGSSGTPVYLWLQWPSSVVCPWYPSVLTESGLEVVRPGHFPACNLLCMQLVWWEFELNWFNLTRNPNYTKNIMVLISKAYTKLYWSTHMC